MQDDRAEHIRQRRAQAFAAKFSADTIRQGKWREPTDDAFAEIFADCVKPPSVALYPAIRATFLAEFAPEAVRTPPSDPPVEPASPDPSDRSTNADPGLDYQARCRLAATAQGLDPIVDRLTAEGISHSVEQTGGWIMVIEIPVTDHTFIGVTADAVQPDHWVVVRYTGPEDEGEPLVPSAGFEVPPDVAVAAIHQHITDATQQQPRSPVENLRQRLDALPDTEPPSHSL